MENIFIDFLPPWVETGLQPAFYDKESGTILQQVSRMYYKMNQIIKSHNDLVKDFKELYDYVHDYFDDLDVQEEINNKLDDMAESGQLQEIIAEYLSLKSLLCFDTLNDMKNSTNLAEGSYAKILGYYTLDDGCVSLYKIKSDSVTQDNGGDKIRISDSLIADLVVEGTVNVRQFGAKGNNTDDDSTAIQNTINYATTNNYKIYIDNKTYLISSPLSLDGDNIEFVCDGTLHTTSNISIIECQGAFQNVTIHQLLGESKTGNGLRLLGHNWYCNYKIDRIAQLAKGIYCYTVQQSQNGVQYCNFDFNYINCTVDIDLDCSNGWINQNVFKGGQLSGNTGVVFEQGENLGDYYNGNVFKDLGFEGNDVAIDLYHASRNTFQNFRYIEAPSSQSYHIRLRDCNSNIFETAAGGGASYYNMIQDNNTTRNYNLFNMRTAAASDFAVMCHSFYYINNIPYFLDTTHTTGFKYIESGNFSTINDKFNCLTSFAAVASDASVNITLDQRYKQAAGDTYKNINYQKVYLKAAYRGNGKNITVTDSDNNIIFNLNDYTADTGSLNKLYEIGYVNNMWYVKALN